MVTKPKFVWRANGKSLFLAFLLLSIYTRNALEFFLPWPFGFDLMVSTVLALETLEDLVVRDEPRKDVASEKAGVEYFMGSFR